MFIYRTILISQVLNAHLHRVVIKLFVLIDIGTNGFPLEVKCKQPTLPILRLKLLDFLLVLFEALVDE